MTGSLIFSTKASARTMLPVSFEHAWHRTGSWADAQKVLAECTAVLKNALSQYKTMNAEALGTSQLWTTLLR